MEIVSVSTKIGLLDSLLLGPASHELVGAIFAAEDTGGPARLRAIAQNLLDALRADERLVRLQHFLPEDVMPAVKLVYGRKRLGRMIAMIEKDLTGHLHRQGR